MAEDRIHQPIKATLASSSSSKSVRSLIRSRSNSPELLRRISPSTTKHHLPSLPSPIPPTPPHERQKSDASGSSAAPVLVGGSSLSNVPTNGSSAPTIHSTTNKLGKWLSASRSRSRSIGSTSLLDSQQPTDSAGAPAASTSTGALPGDYHTELGSSSPKSISPSIHSSSEGRHSPTQERKSFSQRFKRSGKNRSSGGEVLEEWADATLTPQEAAAEQSQLPQRANLPEQQQQQQAKAPGRFSLKKTKSNLRLFGKMQDDAAAASQARERELSNEQTTAPQSHSQIRSVPRNVQSAANTTPTQNDFGTHPYTHPQGSASAAGRIGGWFSSMLNHSPSSLNIPATSADGLPQNGISPGGTSSTSSLSGLSPKKDRLSAPPNSGSPSSTGRLGPLDRMLDKAVQYFLDTDGAADRCPDEIWVLGVRHPGWTPADADEVEPELVGRDSHEIKTAKRKSNLGRKSRSKRDEEAVGRQSTSTSSSPSPSPSPSPQPGAKPTSTLTSPSQTHGWPVSFYEDFYSRFALTYRSGFPGIPCSPGPSGGMHGVLNSLSMSIGRGASRNEGLTSDTGWGCMLRTGQSLLANALVDVHLGRDWRRPLPAHPESHSPPPPTPLLGRYSRLLSLFLDDPSPFAPFSVHRFALEGKQLGKEVGEWFGPSTAAGAIKTLVHAYPPAGLAVCSVVDGSVYRSEVEACSGGAWQTPVLLLIGLRLGIDGVNPIYHEGVQRVFEFPQSVGIAGGRPSSSYYFVGAQAGALFYIDPHHPKPAVHLQPLPEELWQAARSTRLSPQEGESASAEGEQLESFFADAYTDTASRSYHCDRVRKMALASLDPSMLLGFLIRDEQDWEDFQGRVQDLAKVHSPIFALADSPPAWMKRSVGASSFRGPAGPESPRTSMSTSAAGEAELPQEEVEFSEPEDWELESTEGSAASVQMSASEEDDEDDAHESSPSPAPLAATPEEAEEEEWEEEDVPSKPEIRIQEGSADTATPSSSEPPSTVPSTAASATGALPADDQSWYTAHAGGHTPASARSNSPAVVPAEVSTPEDRSAVESRVEDSVVVVSPPAKEDEHEPAPPPASTSSGDVGGRAVLVDVVASQRQHPVRQESIPVKPLEAGWEGVGISLAELDRPREEDEK